MIACLDPVQGHEQQGIRPCVVVTDASVVTRFKMIGIVPLTGTKVSADYPRVQPTRANGLTKPSTALFDQMRSIDPSRISSVAGPVDAPTLSAIDAKLKLFLGL